jgi:hypothetical protein
MFRPVRVATLVASLGVAAALVAVPDVSGASSPTYYLSLGDSYSVGYQPNPTTGGVGGPSTGYTGVVAAAKGYTLENFGCGGATSASLLTFPDEYCGVDDPINNPNGYAPAALSGTVGPFTGAQTQVQAAEAFIAANPNQVALVTVSIGGNDVTPCAAASPTNLVNGAADPISCVAAGVAAIKANVVTVATDLRNALEAADGTKVGTKVPIIGLTYPDVLEGLWVNSGPGGSPADTPTFPASAANQTLASESVTAFQLLINPALKAAYATAHGKFVDVTKKTHAYTKFKSTTKMDIPALGLGTITVPKAVAEVCNLTWYCQYGNIHANDTGYTLIGNLVAAADK